MEEKESYTKQEVEEIIELSNLYREKLMAYQSLISKYSVRNTELEIKQLDYLMKQDLKKLNSFVEECNQKLPKSLIDKIGIKKIE